MLPARIPIFPLPNVVLFPNVFLPLHIFEERYREMVRDALEGDRIIGMVLLKAGWEPEYEGHPTVYSVGCAGVITHVERLTDGRFNLILKGLGKFRIRGEEREKTYRVALVDALPERLTDTDRLGLQDQRGRLEALLATFLDTTELPLPTTMPDEDLVHALAQYLSLEPVERQALLEAEGPLARSRSLAELLEMKLLLQANPAQSRGLH
jgi:Lon protease-like protein